MRENYGYNKDNSRKYTKHYSYGKQRAFRLLNDAAIHTLYISECAQHRRYESYRNTVGNFIHKLSYTVVRPLSSSTVDVFVYLYDVRYAGIGQYLYRRHSEACKNAQKHGGPYSLGRNENSCQQHYCHIYASYGVYLVFVEFFAELYPHEGRRYRTQQRYRYEYHCHRAAGKSQRIVDKEHKYCHYDVETYHTQKITHHYVAKFA